MPFMAAAFDSYMFITFPNSFSAKLSQAVVLFPAQHEARMPEFLVDSSLQTWKLSLLLSSRMWAF
jgi:hypothetical protein